MCRQGSTHPRWPPSSSSCPSCSSSLLPSSAVPLCPSCAELSSSSTALGCSASCAGRDKRQKTHDDACKTLIPTSLRTLVHLPPELGLHILELLYDNVIDVLHLYHTCRHQRALIDNLNVWYKIYHRYFPTWSLGLQGHELLGYRHGFAWVVLNDHRCRLGRPAVAAAVAALRRTLPPPLALSTTDPTTIVPPSLTESPTSLLPESASGALSDPLLDLFHLPISEASSVDEESSDDEDFDDSSIGPQPSATDWLYFGAPVTDVTPGDTPKLLCHVQTRHVPSASFHHQVHQLPEIQHRLQFCLLGSDTCLGTLNASEWSCSRQGPFEGGFAPLYPVAQAVALKVCTRQFDSTGRTRVLVAVVFGMEHDPHEDVLGMMDGVWYDDDDSGDDGDLNYNARYILDTWEALDVVEAWIFIPAIACSTSPSLATLAAPATGDTTLPWRSTSTSSEKTTYLSPISSFGRWTSSSLHNQNTHCSGHTTNFSSGSCSNSNNNNSNDTFTYPLFETTLSPPTPRRLLPVDNDVKLSPCLGDGRRFRGRSARFVSIDGEEYLFLLGLLDGQYGNTSAQIYHVSRGLICSHQMGMYAESIAFFPSHSGYDHLVVLLNWGGNSEVWDIFEGRPVLSLCRDMPRSLSFSSRDVSPRFPDRRAGSRSQHLPCLGDTLWKQVSKDQYKRHGLRTWGIQVNRAVEGEIPIPLSSSTQTMVGGPFRVVTFSDAWESDHQAFQPQGGRGFGRGMWETRWWHLDANDLGPPRVLTRIDLIRPADLAAAIPGWSARIPLPKWAGVERCWIKHPLGPSALQLSSSQDTSRCSEDLAMQQESPPPPTPPTPPPFILEAPDSRVLPRVFAHSRHCEWLTAQPRHGRMREMETSRSNVASGDDRRGSCRSSGSGNNCREKKGCPLPEPTAFRFAMDDSLAFSSPHPLMLRQSFEWLKRIRIKIMLVWHHYRIVATSQRGIYMVDMETEQSQYGGQITVVQPHQVGDLVSISLAGHYLVITRASCIETVPLAGPI